MTTTTTRPRRRSLAAALAGAAVLSLGLTSAATAAPGAHQAPPRSAAVQRELDDLVRENGFPGVLAAVRDADGRVTNYTAGVQDLATGDPIHADGRVRIASNTKTFTAVVVLQLVGEGEVSLDAPVETYLPGVVRGPGGDGRSITVRQLLQQTSGLPDYDTVVADVTRGDTALLDIRHTYFEPSQLLQAALAAPAEFAPGTAWQYSNTNYLLAGLLVQRVTGRPIGEQITQRVIDRLGLEDTYWPAAGEQGIRGEHPRGYLAAGEDAPWTDVTETDPSLGWAAGQLVSTPSDLARFQAAVLGADGAEGSDVLAPAQRAELLQTVPAAEFEPEPGWSYGLGLAHRTLSCGVEAWGHGGDIQGYETRNLVTSDGRSVVVAVTALPRTLEDLSDVNAAVEAAVCDGRS
ncbi:serine hydrolase domain-containing protein [Kineococcus sp. TBRC 1896]|uniref:Serine hydrolase domain-containing protein n=1 Tax=Kineococcus mangrovi TaxID=1660183 RepID=A0ABV4I5H8_9ACTN